MKSPRYDLIITDHRNDINNGAFILRNSEWSHAFVQHWVELSADRVTYPFSDNGPFTESVLRFGSLAKSANCQYVSNACVNASNTRGAPRLKGREWLLCAAQQKDRCMGPWRRNLTRTMGRIMFASTASGFNSHSWEPWKAKTGRQRDSYFKNGMFVLHSKYFGERVPLSSVTCPMAKSSYPNTQGSYVLSEKGVCGLDKAACRRLHFGHSCSYRDLKVVTKEGIEARKELLRATITEKPPIPSALPDNIVQVYTNEAPENVRPVNESNT